MSSSKLNVSMQKTNDTFQIEMASNDYFEFLMENSFIRIFSIVICGINVIVVPLMLYSIIWFDKFGSDKKRTILNMLVSLICWNNIEFNFIIQATVLIRFLYGPLPELYCSLEYILRGAYVSQVFLFFDSIACMRYIFIFFLKNPAAFRDDFWCFFIYIWVKAYSLIVEIVIHNLMAHNKLSYYICTGLDPTEDFKKQLKVYGVVEIGSVFVNVFIWLHIKVYKSTSEKLTVQKSSLHKKEFLKDLKGETLASFTSNLMSILGLALITVSTAYHSSLKPNDIYKHKIFLFGHYLVMPGIGVIFFVLIFYIRHRPLRRVIFTEIKEIMY